ncbi:MAG: ATP-grasp domain-containing protein [Candidatus Sumerlaeia bacterium]|nr:ATP-grasp domain-containing protein [Candidatus Sumerlaeia bacterium]
MRNVIYVVPVPGENSLLFADAFRRLDRVRLLAIVQRRPNGPPPEVLERFEHIVQVDDCFSIEQLAAVVRGYEERYGKTHRIVSALEELQPTLARVRAMCHIEGMMPDAVDRFTNKATMKQALRDAGIAVAKSTLAPDYAAARAFVDGLLKYPVVVKPPVGAGTRNTHLCSNDDELRAAMASVSPSTDSPAQIEEFVEGEEFSFDTITIDGKVRFTSVTQYFPNPLEVVRNPWIQYSIVMPRDTEAAEFADIRAMGTKAVESLGMGSGFTHMEWFRRKDGSVVISEVAARPPGVQIVPMLSYAHDVDFRRVWTRAVVDNAYDGPWDRKYACGVVFLRGVGSGWVSRVDGLDEISMRLGKYVVDARFPQVGVPKSSHYEGEGYVVLRAQNTETIRDSLRFILDTLRVSYTN